MRQGVMGMGGALVPDPIVPSGEPWRPVEGENSHKMARADRSAETLATLRAQEHELATLITQLSVADGQGSARCRGRHDRSLYASVSAGIKSRSETGQSDSLVAHSGAESGQGAGGWEAVGGDGVWLKPLYRDPAAQRRTALVRLHAGVGYPAHRHADTEELYMLAGDLTIEAQVLRAGDFCAAVGGSHHGRVYSAEGRLFLLVASERDEFIANAEAGAPPSGLVFVRASEGSWVAGPTAGVAVKRLFSDPARQTMTALVRIQAGARLPRHRHVTPEQFYMLEGDGHVAGHVLQAGDYYYIAADTVHDTTYTAGGCVFLLIATCVEMLS